MASKDNQLCLRHVKEGWVGVLPRSGRLNVKRIYEWLLPDHLKWREPRGETFTRGIRPKDLLMLFFFWP